MKTEINLKELIEAAEESIKSLDDKKKESLKRRVDRLQEYAVKNDVTKVVRIPVQPTITTVTIETEKERIDTYGAKKINCGTEIIKTDIQEVTVTDDNIISAIKAIFPNDVNNTLYWYDNGNYLFTTDKGKVFNLRKNPRALTTSEKEEINTIITEVMDNKERTKPILHEAQMLQAYIMPKEKRTAEQEEMVNSGELILILLSLQKEFDKAKSSNAFCYGENKNLNMYGETIQENVIYGKIRSAKKLKEEHLQMVDTAINKIYDIKMKCNDECEYYIHPMKENKQIKIYFGKGYTRKYERLGYTVYKNEKEESTTHYTANRGDIILEEVERTRTSFYVQMSVKAFKSCCFQGKICKKGYYFNEDGSEVELTRRPNESVTLTDENGTVMKFNSKSEAAKELKVSQCLISKCIKNGGQINLNNTKDNKKSIKLMTTDYTLLSFSSMTELSTTLNVPNYKVSRMMKGKNKGDTVTFNGIQYTLLG